jgi:hypothetical protein
MANREGAHLRAGEGSTTTLLGRLGSLLRRANERSKERHVRRYGSYAATLRHHPPSEGADAGLGGGDFGCGGGDGGGC